MSEQRIIIESASNGFVIKIYYGTEHSDTLVARTRLDLLKELADILKVIAVIEEIVDDVETD